MVAVPVLADPSVMTAQERTDELAASIARDDLLAVLLVMIYCGVDEVNGAASTSNRTPLETALLAPTVRTPVRRLIVECLLHRGASVAAVLQHPPRDALPAILSVVTRWNAGGRDEATTAYSLCFTMQLNQAEPFIVANGYGPDGPVDSPAPAPPPAQTNGASPAVASPSYARLDGPPSHEASSSSHRRDSSMGKDLMREDSRRDDNPRRAESPPQSPTIVPARRGFSPDRAATPPPPELDHWIFVGGLPQTVAERYIYEQLAAAAISVDDIFLSQSHTKPTRFAYVAVRASGAVQKACNVLARLRPDGCKLHANLFVDKTTGSHKPQISNSEYKRQYVGPERQAQRLPNERQLGLFLLHVSPHAGPSDVSDFLQRSLQREQIGAIEVRHVGYNTLAFVDVKDEDLCRKAIRELDGGCFLDRAVRVSWLELDRREGASRRHRGPGDVPSREEERLAINYQPLVTNRYAALAAKGAAKEPPPGPAAWRALEGNEPAQRSSPPAATDTSTVTLAASAEPVQPDQGDVNAPQRTSAPAGGQVAEAKANAEGSLLERDLDRLRSLGIEPHQIEAIQQMWPSLNAPPSSASGADEPFERGIDAQVRFGFVPQEVAKKALRENSVAPTYPDDRVKQARYEAFLAAQAGESRDYYTVFFAQLAEFNASSGAFAETARAAAAGSTQGTNGAIQVDEEVVKTEGTP
ncbi:hypothetical protein JCM10449v2_002039 [Rhodotorula kratochvilovae]